MNYVKNCIKQKPDRHSYCLYVHDILNRRFFETLCFITITDCANAVSFLFVMRAKSHVRRVILRSCTNDRPEVSKMLIRMKYLTFHTVYLRSLLETNIFICSLFYSNPSPLRVTLSSSLPLQGKCVYDITVLIRMYIRVNFSLIFLIKLNYFPESCYWRSLHIFFSTLEATVQP
jgi:hypothetical protein